jgi:hypothetical protein
MSQVDKPTPVQRDIQCINIPEIEDGKIVIQSSNTDISDKDVHKMYVEKLNNCAEHIHKNIQDMEVRDIQHLADWSGRLKSSIDKDISSRPGFISKLVCSYERNFGILRTVGEFQEKFEELVCKAKDIQQQKIYQKFGFELRRTNLVLESKEYFEEQVAQYKQFLTTIKCPFMFAVIEKDLTEFDVVVYDTVKNNFETIGLKCQLVDGKVCMTKWPYESNSRDFFSIEEIVKFHYKSALPISQVMEVYDTIQKHLPSFDLQDCYYPLTRKELEQKLNTIAKATLRPVYVLRPSNSTTKSCCVLSYTTKRGFIRHVRIDLSYKFGQYTFKDPVSRKICSLTRLQLKKWLEGNGKPVKLDTKPREVLAKDLLAKEQQIELTEELLSHIRDLRSELEQEGIKIANMNLNEARNTLRCYAEDNSFASVFCVRASKEGAQYLTVTAFVDGEYKNYLLSLVKYSGQFYVYGWGRNGGLKANELVKELKAKLGTQLEL